MPTRLLRDWTDSFAVDSLSAEAERLFVRLIMKADDFGRYHSHIPLLRAGCFPLKNALRNEDIAKWVIECHDAGLVYAYEVKSRKYLTIRNFKQRTRAKSAKFPPPDGFPSDWMFTDEVQANGSLMPVACRSHDGHMTDTRRLETETETEAHTETGAARSVEDSLIAEVDTYIRDHPMLTWDRTTSEKCLKLVRAVGWEKAKSLVQEAISKRKPFPIGWALGTAANLAQRDAAGSKPKERSSVAVREDN